MNLSINGQSQVPPGFRFNPTEEELLQYYLMKQVAKEKIDFDVISYIDLNKLEPWDIQERCKIGSTPQNEWYFFSHKDKKYPTGTRTNRATEAGFWKATGRDKIVYNNGRRIGLRKTLVFYIGRAPCGQKSDWIMYEYRLNDNTNDATARNLEEPKADDAWVVCRLFRKKHCKNQAGQQSSSTSTDVWTQIHSSSNDGDLDQILRCMTKPCKQENETTNTAISEGLHNRFTSLPDLESPTINPLLASNSFEACEEFSVDDMLKRIESSCNAEDGLVEWLGLDQLVPSKINSQMKTSKHLSGYGDWSADLGFQLDHHLQLPHLCSNGPNQSSEVYSSGIDLWSFT